MSVLTALKTTHIFYFVINSGQTITPMVVWRYAYCVIIIIIYNGKGSQSVNTCKKNKIVHNAAKGD